VIVCWFSNKKHKGIAILENKNGKNITVSNDKIIDGYLGKKDKVTIRLNRILKNNILSKAVSHKIFTPILYSISGFLLIIFIAILFNTYVLRLKVETAVVSASIETMTAPTNGYVTHIYVSAGKTVKKGSPLIKIENIDLERELQLARIQVDESKLTVFYYQNLLKNEQQRLNIYKKIGSSRVASAQTLVNRSKQNLIITQHTLERFNILNKKNYISAENLETARSKYISAQEELKNAQAHKQLESHSLNALKKGLYFTGNKAEGIERDLYTELNTAKKRVEINKSKIILYENLIKKLTLTAPFDAVIIRILKSTGNTTDTIKPLLLIEKNKAHKTIVAYLTQDEIIHIGSSNKVKIYIPSSGRVYHGRIMEINRTDGFVDAMKAQYRWRDFQIDRSALVTIALQKSEQLEFDKRAFPGLPAVIYFAKKSIF
jgi:multidrug resistance efflux pump